MRDRPGTRSRYRVRILQRTRKKPLPDEPSPRAAQDRCIDQSRSPRRWHQSLVVANRCCHAHDGATRCSADSARRMAGLLLYLVFTWSELHWYPQSGWTLPAPPL